MSHIAGYFVALDMTSRSLQSEAKVGCLKGPLRFVTSNTLLQSKGLPWAVAKGYDTFLPVSSLIPAERIPDPMNVELWCKARCCCC